MRRLVLGIALGAQGCVVVEALDGEELALTSVSTMYVDAKGLELSDDGAAGLVGMDTTTCAVDPAWGSTGADYDVAGTDDRVDAADCGPDNVDCDYLVTSGDRASVVTPDSFSWDGPPTRRWRGLVGAALVDDGVAALVEQDGACVVDFAGRRALQTRATVELPGDACADAVVEAGGGGVFVASDAGLWAVDEGGHDRIADGADALAWDEAAAVLYAADRDGDAVRALEASGAGLWDEPLGGAFVAFDDAGEHASALVMVEDDGGAGRLVLLDGVSGDLVLEESLPGVGRGVRVSADGSRVALLRAGEVMFFDLGDAEPDEDFGLTIEDL